MFLVSPSSALLNFGQSPGHSRDLDENTCVFSSKVAKCCNRFSAVTPPHMVRLTSSTDYNSPEAGMLVVPCTAAFLVSVRSR